MPTHCRPDSLDFGSVEGRSIVAAFDGGEITSDGGVLLLARTNAAIRLTDRAAAAFTDRRNPDLVEHEVKTMVGQRIIGEALGYPDINDHDRLRHDPLLAAIMGKLTARDATLATRRATRSVLRTSRASMLERTCKAGHAVPGDGRGHSGADRGRHRQRGVPCDGAAHSRAAVHRPQRESGDRGLTDDTFMRIMSGTC